MKKSNLVYLSVFLSSIALLFTIQTTWKYSVPPAIQNPIKKYAAVEAYIVQKWKVDPKLANKVILEAKKHSQPIFPKKEDVLAIIAIESGFKTSATSSANAKGLMQVLYKPTTFDVSANMADGVFLLKDYYSKFNNINATIQSYNVGIGAYKRGSRNLDYLSKYYEEREIFKSLLQGQ